MAFGSKPGALFPAQAGVIPKTKRNWASTFAFPRASGGDPDKPGAKWHGITFPA